MADKKVEIRFETQADTKGAKDAEKALDQVKDAADDTSSALDQAGAAADETGDELKLPEAKQGTKSLNQLTAELQRLEKELLDLPVGSKGFVDLAQKVKTAQKELEDAETVARKLGGTVGRKGNAGMAVLEFSRAFEDAQYGIRGVLNNIPIGEFNLLVDNPSGTALNMPSGTLVDTNYSTAYDDPSGFEGITIYHFRSFGDGRLLVSITKSYADPDAI